ncbi:MAG: McrC family protein, partial [Prosthecobacter sp.]|nr:McrC family protein [Prosthecobacter sp.]
GWKQAHGLAQAPLSFGGNDGCVLSAQQYVGVVEAAGARVEIYPKLDAALVQEPGRISERKGTVMASLLWLLEQSGYGGLVDAGEASVAETPESITDLLTWLFARRLRHQLSLGLPQDYVGLADDLPLLRGRLDFARQAGTLFGRPDVLACRWDEWTPDTPLARLLRCATELLLARVRLPTAAADLRDALAMLDDVARAHPLQVLAAAQGIRWSRLNLRWRPCFDLALAVLRGLGRDLHGGGTESFVFLLDMNALFESYCACWIERNFPTSVCEQAPLGALLPGRARSLGQVADFLWHLPGEVWVGDAKYKLPSTQDWPQIDDVRQLICYGQLAKLRHPGKTSRLMLLYPTLGAEAQETCTTFDGQPLCLQAVSLARLTELPKLAGAGMPGCSSLDELSGF